MRKRDREILEHEKEAPLNVEYTVKEILTRIETDIKQIMGLMQTKVERSEMDQVRLRLENLERHGSETAQHAEKKLSGVESRVKSLETDNGIKDSVQKNEAAWHKNQTHIRYLVAGLLFNGILAAASIIGLFLSLNKVTGH